ncbi:MAG TPA: hypothetical protein PKM03_07460, partial [Cyclobacteriaceae bacterium]|nr:hypothetical protein [Cyclobacteriaceae bacterium]
TAAADAIKFTLDKSAVQQPAATSAAAATAEPVVTYAAKETQQTLAYNEPEVKLSDMEQKRADMACSLDNPEACEACGS